MKKLFWASFLFSLLIAPAGAISEFDCWGRIYPIYTAPLNYTVFELTVQKSAPFPFTTEITVNKNTSTPTRFFRLESDWEDVMPYTVIKKHIKDGAEIHELYSNPPKKLGPGFHVFLIEAGLDAPAATYLYANYVDPEMNVFSRPAQKEIKQLFGKAQDQRAKTQTLDCRFNLSSTSRKGKTVVEQAAQGRIDITGEDLFSYTLASMPEVKVNGRLMKGKGAESFIPMQKKGSRLLLSPYHLAYYIPYDDLFDHYNWHMFKRIGPKAWMMGELIHRDKWLPQFIKLVMDEKRGLPLEVSAYIYNKKFAAAVAKIEYNKNGLPIRQTVERRLPGGEHETSTIILTNLEPNKRAPKKRWLLF